MPSESLTYSALDDLGFAVERHRLSIADLPNFRPDELGPLLELTSLRTQGLLPEIPLSGGSEYNDLLAAASGNEPYWCPYRSCCGFTKVRQNAEHDIVKLGIEAQKAASSKGIPKSVAAQLASMVGELSSNILEHAGTNASGLVAFSALADGFELVAADNGIGVLASLQSSSEFADLKDHGTSLRLALTEGVSRFGQGSGRGFGFRPLFIGLANLNGLLRFRSGNSALVIDGTSPSLVAARLAEKPNYRGFFCSIRCSI